MKIATFSRWAAVGGLAAGVVAATIVVTGAAGSPGGSDDSAAEPAPTATMPGGKPGGTLDPRMAGMAVGWSATTPATHEGDTYRLVVTNGATAQRVFVSTVIMDHKNDANTRVLSEMLQLAPGETRELTAVNNYGTANHFTTRIASENQDLQLHVTVTDASGAVVAQFNQGAFMVTDIAGRGQRGQPGQHEHGKHDRKTPTPTPSN